MRTLDPAPVSWTPRSCHSSRCRIAPPIHPSTPPWRRPRLRYWRTSPPKQPTRCAARPRKLAIWTQYQLRGAPNFNIYFNREVSRRVFEEHLEDSPLPARVYALLHAVYQDAWITTQDAKFTYWTARPTMFDSSITTLFPNPP